MVRFTFTFYLVFRSFAFLRSSSSLSLNVRRTAVHRRWSGLPCCCCPYLEQSAPTCHVRTFYDCFPRSPQAWLFSSDVHSHDLPNFFSACAVIKVVIFGHFNRSFLLFTYCIMYSVSWHWASSVRVGHTPWRWSNDHWLSPLARYLVPDMQRQWMGRYLRQLWSR